MIGTIQRGVSESHHDDVKLGCPSKDWYVPTRSLSDGLKKKKTIPARFLGRGPAQYDKKEQRKEQLGL